jgi:hypothetical protein
MEIGFMVMDNWLNFLNRNQLKSLKKYYSDEILIEQLKIKVLPKKRCHFRKKKNSKTLKKASSF